MALPRSNKKAPSRSKRDRYASLSAAAAIDLVTPRLRRWVWLAAFASLALHLLIAVGAQRVQLHRMAVPNEQRKYLTPIQLKLVETPETGTRAKDEKVESPASFTTMAQDPTPAKEFSSDGAMVARALANTQQQLALPSPADPATILNPQMTPSTTFTPSAQAKIEAEMSRLPVGPNATEGVPAFVPSMPVTKGMGTGTTAGPGGVGGIDGPIRPGGNAVPGFDAISSSFATPAPVANPKLPEPVLLRLPSDVLFDYNSAVLRSEAFPLLQQAVALIRKYPVARVSVEGHTDTIGSEAYNQNLAAQRAQAVEEYMQQSLTGPNFTFTSRGWGKSRPIVNPNGTVDEQARNRRVEITIQALTIQ